MPIAVDSAIVSDVCQVTPDQAIQYALIAIAYYESGWDPNAEGDWTIDCANFYPASSAPLGAWPTSFGYLQLHSSNGGCPPGLGNGYSISQLLTPTFNLQVGASYLSNGLALGSSLDSLCSAAWTTWRNGSASALYSQFVTQGITPTCSGGGGGGGGCGGCSPSCPNGTCPSGYACVGGSCQQGGGGGSGGCATGDYLCQLQAWWSSLAPTDQLLVGAAAALVVLDQLI
jgi:hypothetical protein